MNTCPYCKKEFLYLDEHLAKEHARQHIEELEFRICELVAQLAEARRLVVSQ
jgi:hypothetical protein